jgi:hypothetical protein
VNKLKSTGISVLVGSSSEGPLWSLARRVTQADAENFASELLNLDIHNEGAQRRFCEKHGDMIPWSKGSTAKSDQEIDALMTSQGANRVWMLRQMLSGAWRMPTSWDREIALAHPLYVALGDFYESHSPNPANSSARPFPARTTAAAKTIGVLLRIQRSADRLRFCGNPDCPAPYFIARRSTQRYCSESCAGPAERESKRVWWKEHGSDRRRKAKKPK